jgi:disulfide bond formation protein DsbB
MIIELMNWFILFATWLISCIATLGSLFFSEVMMFPPCNLCWFQRIAMYPLTILLLPAILKFDRSVFKFTLPLASIGWLIAVFHSLIYYGFIPETASPCSQGVSCTAVHIEFFGFMSIPFLSALAFTLILILLLTCFRKSSP